MCPDDDIRFMSQALSLAEKGRGTTSPNPMVGSVVVKDGRIIGSGFHQYHGGDHAEVIALREAGDSARGATLYVTLEPCCHYGKTPPCTKAILKSGISRVVIAMSDPNPLVCGGGITILENAGIRTKTGILEDAAKKLNEAYVKYIVYKIPFLTLKLAVTLDGKLADRSGNSTWITGPETRKWVHRLRAWSDAVMVGAGTVLADDPELNVRDAEGSNPIRIIIDESLDTPPDARVCSGDSCIVATSPNADVKKQAVLTDRGVTVLKLGNTVNGISLRDVLKYLGEQGIISILCEGGGMIAGSLLTEKLVDKVIYTIAPKLLGDGKDSLSGFHTGGIEHALQLENTTVETIENDIIVSGYPLYRQDT